MTVLNFRTDAQSEAALRELTADGRTTSEAIRRALIDAAKYERRERMRIESLEIMNDPEEVAEMRRVMEEMNELRAW